PRRLRRLGDAARVPQPGAAPRGTDGRRLASLRVRMDSAAWEPFYVQILDDFRFSQADDEAVARDLDTPLGGRRATNQELRILLHGREVTVAGNGPNLAAELDDVRGILVTADEATSVALGRGLRPAIL